MGEVIKLDSVRTSKETKDAVKRAIVLMHDKELLNSTKSLYSSFVTFALYGLRMTRIELEQMPHCQVINDEITVIINAVRAELESLIKLKNEVEENE